MREYIPELGMFAFAIVVVLSIFSALIYVEYSTAQQMKTCVQAGGTWNADRGHECKRGAA